MLNRKNGIAIISGILCFVCIALITTALVAANVNSSKLKASKLENVVTESNAYIKKFTLNEVKEIAKKAYVNNYLTYHEGFVELSGFERIIMDDILKTVPEDQLQKFTVYVYEDSINVDFRR